MEINVYMSSVQLDSFSVLMHGHPRTTCIVLSDTLMMFVRQVLGRQFKRVFQKIYYFSLLQHFLEWK